MRVRLLGVFALVTLAAATVPSVAIAADNTDPIADAGVDQEVTPNTTVYLDASGSLDPDGTVSSVSWTIETPTGETVDPNCPECRQTRFETDTSGEYTVTLTVTDDDGATRSDTLYVTATASSGPEVTISTPDDIVADNSTTLTADVSASESLQTLAWVVDGSIVNQTTLSGTDATVPLDYTFESNGTASVQVVVYDVLGQRGSVTDRVEVLDPVSAMAQGSYNPSDPCPDSIAWYGDDEFHGCRDGADTVYAYPDGTYIVDTNDQEGVQLYDGNQIANYGDLSTSNDVSMTESGVYRIEEGNTLSDITDTFSEQNGSTQPSTQNLVSNTDRENEVNNDNAEHNSDDSNEDDSNNRDSSNTESRPRNKNVENSGSDTNSENADEGSDGVVDKVTGFVEKSYNNIASGINNAANNIMSGNNNQESDTTDVGSSINNAINDAKEALSNLW